MQSKQKYDAIIIGAGLGGLSAAGYLAKAGKRVLLLEHHSVPGGYAHEFRRGKYRFDVALHALDGVAPGGWSYVVLNELKVLSRVRFHRLDPFYTVRFPEHVVTAYADLFQYESHLIQHFPDEAQGIHHLIDAMRRVFDETRRFMCAVADNRRPPLEHIMRNYPNMVTAQTMSWADFMDQYLNSLELKGIWSALWGYYGLPPQHLNAATFIYAWISYHIFGAYYPEGGSMAVSRALEVYIQSYLGDIRYRQTVTKIHTQGTRALGVETASGLCVEADVIISNASAPTTLLEMVGTANLPESYVTQLRSANNSMSSLVVYLGLERELTREIWPYHELFTLNTYDLSQDYRFAENGDFENAGFVLTHYTGVDRNAAPEGCSIVTLMAPAFWQYANQWGTGGDLSNYRTNPQYLALKATASDQLIARAEACLPGLRDSIRYCETATPITNYRYTLNPGGAIYGRQQSVEDMYSGRRGERTPIENLFLAGAWAFSGGMSAALLSGKNTARIALGYLEGEEHLSMLGGEFPRNVDEVIETDIMPEDRNQQPHKIPHMTLEAAVSKRRLRLGDLGIPTVLLVYKERAAELAAETARKLRVYFPDAEQILVASIVNLSHVPTPFRAIARAAMKRSYQEAASRLLPGNQPEEYVVILPDWDGSVTQALNCVDSDTHIGAVVLDVDGAIIAQVSGTDLTEALISSIRKVLQTGS